MGELTEFLKNQNVDPNSVLIPTREVRPDIGKLPSFSEFNKSGNRNILDIDLEADANLQSLLDVRNDLRARKQGAVSKIANTIGQGTGTFLTATLSSLASVGGGLTALGAEALTGGEAEGMDIMLNNPVMQGISELDKYIKQDLLPTYYTEEQQQSLLSAATATDGINGLGFLLSNILPGLGVTKALGGVSKIGNLAKLGKLEQYAERATKMGLMKTDEAAKLVAYGNFMKNIPAVTGAIVGRLGESAMEANGIYEQLINEGFSEEEAKNQRDNVFYGNMALAVSDLAQFTRWFKPNPYELIVKQGVGYGIKQLGKKELVTGAIKEAIQEGGEEGFQFILGEGAKKDASDIGNNFISNVIESAGDAFTTVEGQKSMLLGALLGAGAGAVFKNINSKQVNEQLNSIITDLNSNPSITSDKFIKNAEDKYVLNPEFVKQNNIISNLEIGKQKAIEQGDLEEAELIDKLQMAALVNSRVQANKFDDLIEEFETIGQADDVELEQYFGTIPTDKEGNKLTARQIADTKIQQAKEMKKMVDGINLIPEFQSLNTKGKSLVAMNLLTQDSIVKQLNQIDNEIAQLSVPTYSIPFTTGTTSEIKEVPINPINQKRIEELEKSKKELTIEYNKITDQIKSFTEKPEKINQKVEKINEEEEKKFEDTIDKEKEKRSKEDELIDKAIKNGIEVAIQTPEGEISTKVIGRNPETGEIETESGYTVTPEDVLKSFNEEEEDFPEYSEDTVKITTGAKKPSVYSTSTSAHEYDSNGSKFTDFIQNPWNELQYSINLIHASIVKYMSNYKNTPSATKQYTVKLSLQPITEDLLINVNKRRSIMSKELGLKPLTLDDLSKPEYRPIITSIYENGKLVSADVTHLHDIDYFYSTSEYERLLSEGADDIIKINLEKFKNDRIKIVNILDKNESAELQVVNKSNGIPNFNPLKSGKKQVSPIYEVFGNILGKDNSGTPSRGIGVIYNVTEDSYEVRFENGQRQTYTIEAGSTIQPVKGLPVFETISANGTPYLLDCITFNETLVSDLQSITNMISHRLFNGNELKKGNQTFELVNSNKTGILNTLLYLGPQTKKEKQLFFKKDGTLVVGKQEFSIDNDQQQVKEAIFNHLSVHHKYPKYSLGAIKSNIKIILPSQIDVTGKILSDESIQTVEKYLFAGDNPLVGTNINSNIQFINSYFTYETDSNGLVIKTNEVKEEPKPFANDLSKQPSQVKPDATDIEAEKADIERKRQKDLNNAILFLINDGTYGGSRDFSLAEYLNIQTKENGEKYNANNWNYINVNGTGVFFLKEEGTAYIVPNNSYTKNPRIVKIFFNKGTQRVNLSSPNINTPNLKMSAEKDNINYDSLLQEVQNVLQPLDTELAALENKNIQLNEVTKKAEQLNKDCDNISGDSPLIKGNGGIINPEDMDF